MSEPARPATARPRLLVLASTFPSHPDDGVPAFVLDLARQEAVEFDTAVLTPRVAGAARAETVDGVRVRRFAYFPRRFEDLADGAILDNLKADRKRVLQVPALVAAQWLAVRRAVRAGKPDVIHAHWAIPQAFVAALAAPGVPPRRHHPRRGRLRASRRPARPAQAVGVRALRPRHDGQRRDARASDGVGRAGGPVERDPDGRRPRTGPRRPRAGDPPTGARGGGRSSRREEGLREPHRGPPGRRGRPVVAHRRR
ncbi:hypothetical protein DEJ15_13280 [Curtobacterium sp. MCJR17_043]|nr:hypothetical protein [Curtobacterium sp. MCJR17_043]WIB35297.1 hypothetical protein DEJ15_13280 [Curtobacterium sp. MCJR17_043]